MCASGWLLGGSGSGVVNAGEAEGVVVMGRAVGVVGEVGVGRWLGLSGTHGCAERVRNIDEVPNSYPTGGQEQCTHPLATCQMGPVGPR